jgi:hypothetical protein
MLISTLVGTLSLYTYRRIKKKPLQLGKSINSSPLINTELPKDRSTRDIKSSCDPIKCNNFMYDEIVTRDHAFDSSVSEACKQCNPLKYAWIENLGLAVDRGQGFVPCGDKLNCYSTVRIT